MKLLNAFQMQEWDACTIKRQHITSLDLMERASQGCADWLVEKELHLKSIKIFCGKGNNGGDGVAIARQLIAAGGKPDVYIAEFGATGTIDFQANLKRLQQLKANIHFIQSAEEFPKINGEDIIIDALFGFGLNRPLSGLYQQLVNYINNNTRTVIAIDVPSGLFTDASSKGNTIIKAQDTLTFQTLKFCFLVAENAEYFGNIHVLPINLDKKCADEKETLFEIVDEEKIAGLYKPRNDFSHKGTYGHALLIAGNTGKMGACVICTRACLRSGIGLLTCAIPKEEFYALQIAAPEAMVTERNDESDITKYTTIGIGPGIGTESFTVQYLHEIIQSFMQPMVLDADALNIISKNKDWLKLLPPHSIITPHPKEFDRLFGESNNDFERIQKAIDASVEYQLVIVLKGHYTLIAEGGKGYFNTTGNPGMATGGSGDMLTGIITALLAQKYDPLHAALTGIYIHGLSADICLDKQSYESLLPSDMIENLGSAFKLISKKKGVQE